MNTHALRIAPILALSLLGAALPGCGRERPTRTSDTPAPLEADAPRPIPAPPPGAARPGDAVDPAPEEQPQAAREEPAPASAQTASEPALPARTPDVVYVPTPQPVVDRMLEMAKVTKNDVVYDLGCGDGRIVVTAAKRYGARAFGFDIDPRRVAEAKENVRANGVDGLVTIEQKDIFTIDLSPATVVTLYLLPALNVRLIPQLEKLRPGARVVSHDFDMAGVDPVAHVQMTVPADSNVHQVYLWRAPIKSR